MYIADALNNSLRQVTVATGVNSLSAGTGTSSYSGDTGGASSAALAQPRDVALDSSGF